MPNGFDEDEVASLKTRVEPSGVSAVAPGVRREIDTACIADLYATRLTREELAYHAMLRNSHGFDLMQLIASRHTIYRRGRYSFVFLLKFGQTGRRLRSAFKIDVFDLRNGSHVGYCDISVPGQRDFAWCDEAVTDFPSLVGDFSADRDRDAASAGSTVPLEIDSANEVRTGWPREGLWVRADYRGARFGTALMRMAGDVCKLIHVSVASIGIILPSHCPSSYAFHKKAGARDVDDPFYRLEYPLHAADRPAITLLYGL